MAHRGIALVGILVLTGGFFCWLRLPSEARGPSTGNSQLLRDLVLHQRITGTGRILEGPPYQEAMAVVHHRRRSSHGAEEIAIDAAAGRVTIDGPRANGPPRASPLSARQHGCSICIDGERIRDLTLPVGEACVEPATGNEVGNSVYWPLRTPNLHGKSCVEAGHARVTITWAAAALMKWLEALGIQSRTCCHGAMRLRCQHCHRVWRKPHSTQDCMVRAAVHIRQPIPASKYPRATKPPNDPGKGPGVGIAQFSYD